MNKLKMFNKLVYFTGFCTLSTYAYHSYFVIKPLFFRRKEHLQELHTRYGSGYAVVTGPTSGIGLAFTNEFSRLGFNVCLVGRNQNKLESLKKRLEQDYSTKPKIIVHDFAEGNKDKLALLKTNLNKLEDISIVVNNVGAQFEHTKKFESLSPTDLVKYVNVNMLSQLSIYNSVLSKLRYQKHKSLIIDVSSIVADSDVMAGNIVYTSTKGFNSRFSNLIKFQMETENVLKNVCVYNVDVAVFKPGRVDSELGFNTNERAVSAERSVTCCLYDIVNGRLETNGAVSHTFLHSLLKIVPQPLINKFYAYKRYKQDISGHENILEKEE